MALWHTVASVKAGWTDAPSDTEITELLETAQDAVLDYAPRADAPAAPEGTDDYDAWLRGQTAPIKTRWRRAQLLHIKDEWNSEKQASDSDSDTQGFDGAGGTARVYRLSLRVKRLLRPESAGDLIG